MKINFTCPFCGGHILDHVIVSTQSTRMQIIGMDANKDAVHSDNPDEHHEQENSSDSFLCGQCLHQVAGDVTVESMVLNGLADGWLKEED